MDATSQRFDPCPVSTDLGHHGLDSILTSTLSATDTFAYDQFVATVRGSHYSQTRAWAPVATAGKPFVPHFFLARREGSVVGVGLVLRTRLGGLPLPIAQVERGPVCATPQDLPDVLAVLHRCCLARGIVRLAVMPYWTDHERAVASGFLRGLGFADCQRFAGRHARTLRLDLTALASGDPFGSSGLAKMRQNIGRATRAGASARLGRREDLAAFRALQVSLLAQEGRKAPASAWYEALGDYFLDESGRGAMFVCEHAGEVVSAIFVTLHGGIATYALGATSGQPLRFSKTVLPMSEAILWARDAGARTFDMGGIPMPGDPDSKRASIAEFKHSYSRTAVSLVHEHVRWF